MWEETVINEFNPLRRDYRYILSEPEQRYDRWDIEGLLKAQAEISYNKGKDDGYALAVKHCQEVMIPQAEKEVVRLERERIIKWIEGNNPFIGYVDAFENIRMAKEQGWNRVSETLRNRRSLKEGK